MDDQLFVIHPPIPNPVRGEIIMGRTRPRVLVGKKSDGAVALFYRNYHVLSLTLGLAVGLVLAAFSAFFFFGAFFSLQKRKTKIVGLRVIELNEEDDEGSGRAKSTSERRYTPEMRRILSRRRTVR